MSLIQIVDDNQHGPINFIKDTLGSRQHVHRGTWCEASSAFPRLPAIGKAESAPHIVLPFQMALDNPLSFSARTLSAPNR
jgi:hypothetical protein